MVSARDRAAAPSSPQPWWSTSDGDFRLFRGDSLQVLPLMPAESVDTVFADPPYFLSNGGTTCHGGRRVRVDKGAWDESRGVDENHAFNRAWLEACRRVLKPDGTLWVSGTSHVIHSVAFAMQQLGFKLLNDIVWEKPNPPPNLSCRYFTHSSELLIWAARGRKSRHHFAYKAMREAAGGRQMKSVWRLQAPGKVEKTLGRHPTQKPLALLERVLTASCPPGSVVLDPFSGSGTTGIAALRLGHRYLGIEREDEFLELAKRRALDERPDKAATRLRLVGAGAVTPP